MEDGVFAKKMRKIKLLLRKLYLLYLAIVGVVMFVIILIVVPYQVASNSLTGSIFWVYGIFSYIIILLLTAELVLFVFGDLYNFKRKSILFSSSFRDGNAKPKSEKPTTA